MNNKYNHDPVTGVAGGAADWLKLEAISRLQPLLMGGPLEASPNIPAEEKRRLALLDIQERHAQKLRETGIFTGALAVALNIDGAPGRPAMERDIPYRVCISQSFREEDGRRIKTAYAVRFVTLSSDIDGKPLEDYIDVPIWGEDGTAYGFTRDDALTVKDMIQELEEKRFQLLLTPDLADVMSGSASSRVGQ